MIEEAWQKKFYQPLVGTVEEALMDKEQPSSPLTEAIYSISDRADFQPQQAGRRVVLVSDLMQHSGGFSFYKMGADYDAYLESELAETKPKLEGVDVVARIVPRQIYDLPVADVKGFWRAYFNDAGATYGSVN
jgi:CubicO group peptidase (beta-lactamase class C family)